MYAFKVLSHNKYIQCNAPSNFHNTFVCKAKVVHNFLRVKKTILITDLRDRYYHIYKQNLMTLVVPTRLTAHRDVMTFCLSVHMFIDWIERYNRDS